MKSWDRDPPGPHLKLSKFFLIQIIKTYLAQSQHRDCYYLKIKHDINETNNKEIMPIKLTYEAVKKYFEDNGCVLTSKEYLGSRYKLKYIASCGHERESRFFHIKLLKQFLCKKCTIIKCNNSNEKKRKYFSTIRNKMHPKTYTKRQRQLEREYKRCMKYRCDYFPENYNQQLTCWDCKETKSRRLFPYRKQYKYNKEKRCKRCNALNNEKRRKFITVDQMINAMLASCRHSAKRRGKKDKSRGMMEITLKDIQELKDKQNNKCVYTGRELLWKYNDHNKASIDRIDSSKGYIPSNIQLVIHIANQAKSNLSEEEFRSLMKDIYKMNYTNIQLENKTLETDKKVMAKTKNLLKTCKLSASKRKDKQRIECGEMTLTTKDILELKEKQMNRCVLSGRILRWKYRDRNMVSIDRIDSSKGYTKDNVQLVSWVANQAKNNMTNMEVAEFAKDMYEHMGIGK